MTLSVHLVLPIKIFDESTHTSTAQTSMFTITHVHSSSSTVAHNTQEVKSF